MEGGEKKVCDLSDKDKEVIMNYYENSNFDQSKAFKESADFLKDSDHSEPLNKQQQESTMNKQEFKKAYGEYRKMVSGAFYRGVEAYRSAIGSNPIFRKLLLSEPLPTSLSISNYKLKKKAQ